MAVPIYLTTEITLTDVNTELFVSAGTPVGDWDYDIQVNLTQAELFEVATYRQPANEPNNFTTTLTVGVNNVDSQLNDTAMSPNGTTPCVGRGIVASDSAGARLLEVLAIKIFGHAKARAAIENDTVITARQSEIASKLAVSFNTDRNLIFNQYVNLDRVELNAHNVNDYNDVDADRTYNFSGLSFEVPLRVVGSVDTGASGEVLNGPAVGGALVVNGAYNVPLKITLNIA
jgi:hypothetical protein